MSEQAPEELPEPGPPAAPQTRVLGAVAAGGALGALARYGALVLWPTADGGFPWTVFAVNVSGCALIGVLMVLTVERGRVTHPLVRPFLGVGVLGGFTTFSTYAADVRACWCVRSSRWPSRTWRRRSGRRWRPYGPERW
ncbi:Putative fluoride ion transporter CrcB [Streptomyces microflavus]